MTAIVTQPVSSSVHVSKKMKRHRVPPRVKMRVGLRVQFEPEENVTFWGLVRSTQPGLVVVIPDCDCTGEFSLTEDHVDGHETLPTLLETIGVEVEGWSTDGGVYGDTGVFIGPGSKVFMISGGTYYYDCTVVERGSGPAGTCVVRVNPSEKRTPAFNVVFPVRHLLAEPDIENIPDSK